MNRPVVYHANGLALDQLLVLQRLCNSYAGCGARCQVVCFLECFLECFQETILQSPRVLPRKADCFECEGVTCSGNVLSNLIFTDMLFVIAELCYGIPLFVSGASSSSFGLF